MTAPAGFKVLSDTGDHDCPVCFEPMLQCAYLNPCRHSLCGSCALQLDECPLCRTMVQSVSRNRDISAAVAAGARFKCTTCKVVVATRPDADAHRCIHRGVESDGAAAESDGQAALETAPAHRRPSEEGVGDTDLVATQPRRARSPVPVPESEPAAGGGGAGDDDSPFGAAFRALLFGASPQRAPQPAAAAAATQSATPVRRHVDPVGPQTVVRRATQPPAAPTTAVVPSTVSALVRSLQTQGFSNKDIAVAAGYKSAHYDRDVGRMLDGTCQRQGERHRDLVAALWNKSVPLSDAPRQYATKASTAAVSSRITKMALPQTAPTRHHARAHAIAPTSHYAKPKAASATPVQSLSSAVAALRSKGFSNKDIARHAGYSGLNNARDVGRMASGQCTGHTERLGRLKQLLKR